MQNTKPKSAVAAGLLGLFLGQFGAHSWYLGKKKQGIAHVCLFAGSMILMIIAMVIIFSSARTVYSYSSYRVTTGAAPIAAILLMILAWLLTMGNGIWALVESIILFAQGDAGLAAKGYTVATAYHPAAVPGAPVANPTAQPTPGAAAPTGPATAPAGSAATTTNPATATPNPANPAANPVQPVAPQPKQPMNPATKKKIIIGCVIGAVVLVAIIVACVVIAIVSHVDYSETYRKAKDLKEDISNLYVSYDCERVVSSVNSDWTSDSNYKKYIESCKNSTDGIDDKIAELEKTAGIRKNSELSAAFDRFKKEYTAVVPNADELNSKLELYKTWHSYVVAVDDLSASDTDAEIQSAANILINSGSDAFKTYGEGWLEKTMDYVRAYREYQNSSYSDSNRSTLRDTMYAKQKAQSTWVSENEPDITELVPLDFSDMTKMNNAYRDFYNLLTDTYEQNYNSDSGDCTELYSGDVYCI